MLFSAAAMEKLRSTNVHPRLLVTIGAGRLSDKNTNIHPAKWNYTIRMSCHNDVHVTSQDGRTYPFWGFIQNYPKIEHTLNLDQRKASNSNFSFKILNTSDFITKYGGLLVNSMAWCHVALWVPGTDLEDSMTLASGTVDPNWASDGGSIDINVTDEYDGVLAQYPFPTEKIDVADFPFVPDYIAAKQPRLTIHGPLEYLIQCSQIDRLGRVFYICEPPMKIPPNRFYINDIEITDKVPFKVLTGQTASSEVPYTLVEFTRPPVDYGYIGALFCSGGFGGNPNHPITEILNFIPNLKLAPSALSAINKIERGSVFDVYSLYTSGEDPISVLEQRLLPQVNMAGAWMRGAYNIFDLSKNNSYSTMTVGGNLLYEIDKEDSITSIDNVYNSIEVKYRTTNTNPPDDATYGLHRVVIDENTLGAIGRLLQRSQSYYGKRHLVVEASDVYKKVYAERLAKEIAKITAFKHKNYYYKTTWTHGLRLFLNQGIYLNDSFRNITNLKTRITSLSYNETNIGVVFQSEDLDVI